MYKVFIENTPLTFQKGKENIKIEEIKQFLPTLKTEDFLDFSNQIKKINEQLVIKSENPIFTMKQFFNNFKKIKAAGGIVFHPTENKILFIKRNGIWDLPKGKIEKGEGKKHAAKREVSEECGIPIENINISKKHDKMYHVYVAYDQHWFKTTYWYIMTIDTICQLQGQLEEGITEIKWISTSEIKDEIYTNTFDSIKSILDKLL